MRVFDATVTAAHAADYQRQAWLVKFDFPTPIYSTTADKTLTYDGNSYSPDGVIATIDILTERADAKVQTVDLNLNPTAAVMSRLDEAYQYAVVEVYCADLDDDHAIIDVPTLQAVYYMSHHTVRGEKDKLEVALTCYSRTLPYRRRSGVISAGSDQKARFATDTCFDFTDKIVGRILSWGGMTGGSGSGAGSDGGSWAGGGNNGQGGIPFIGSGVKPPFGDDDAF